MVSSVVPIAIIGMSCRFSGDATDPERLWKMLAEGRDAWSEVPTSRYRWDSFHSPNSEAQASINHRGGCFLNQNLGAFDARFFGIPRREAEIMDPQQRILLEVVYEALENAGIPLEQIQSSDTGVFLATFTRDYERMQHREPISLPNKLVTGTGTAILANRISYAFDLKGPSTVVDTACSGSLVALHQACQAIRLGEVHMAISGAANLIIDPEMMLPMTQGHFFNSEGKSHPFDVRGDGYGRGEGTGIVILKRLDAALKDGEAIRAIIRDTGVGQDGKTNGITLPNADAQAELAKRVYARADIQPEETIYIEAHGTGTVAGDLAEIRAIEHTFCDQKTVGPLYVGSIKANIGHTEAASGIASVIKATLSVEKGFILPNPKIEELKSNMISDSSNIQVPQTLQPWPAGTHRRASVNSFGYGGTNAHCIIEAANHAYFDNYARQCGFSSSHANGYPLRGGPSTDEHIFCNRCEGSIDYEEHVECRDGYFACSSLDSLAARQSNGVATCPNGSEGPSEAVTSGELLKSRYQDQFVLPITATSRTSLARAVENVHDWIAQNPGAKKLEELAYTLTLRRSMMPWRKAIVVGTFFDVGIAHNTAAIVPVEASSHPQIVFIFTGQGANWCQMGRGLLCGTHSGRLGVPDYSLFAKSLQQSTHIFRQLGANWDLLDELQHDEVHSSINQCRISQPACTAIQIALTDLLCSFGIKPKAVVGHSSGEIAAAYAAGFISSRAALEISYYRGVAAGELGTRGAMLVTSLGESEAAKILSSLGTGKAVVACVNSPNSTTISGDEAAIYELRDILQKASIPVQLLKIDTAYHSHHMEAVADAYLTAMGNVQTISPDNAPRFFSSVTGKEKQSAFDAAYWVQNLVSTVRFSEAVQTAYYCITSETEDVSSPTPHLFIEIGPHPALARPTKDILTQCTRNGKEWTHLFTLKRGCNDLTAVLETCGALFEKGYPVDLVKANSLTTHKDRPAIVNDLRPYPFDHSSIYWHEPRTSKRYRFREYPCHDLLGLRSVESSPAQPAWRQVLSMDTLPWLQDHVIDGSVVLPASAYIAMAVEAKKQISGERGLIQKVLHYLLKDIMILKPLRIPEPPGSVEIQLTFKKVQRVVKNDFVTWEAFTISSVSQEDVWSEHTNGLISIELVSPANSSLLDVQKERDALAKSQEERLLGPSDHDVRRVDPKQLYDNMKAKGNLYGPSFAVISKYDLGRREAVGEITVPGTTEGTSLSPSESYVIHPGPLDALIHSCLPILFQEHSATAIVTASIEELVISAESMNEAGSQLSFATSMNTTGPSSALVDIVAFKPKLDGTRAQVIRMSGGKLKALPESQTKLSDSSDDYQRIYTIQWLRDVSVCLPGSFKFSPPSGTSPEAKVRHLNQAAAIYVMSFLENFGKTSVSSRWKGWFEWMQRFTVSKEYTDLLASIPATDKDSIISSLSTLGVEGECVMRFGTNIHNLVTEKTDALTLALDGDLLYRGYLEDGSSRCYSHLSDFAKCLAFKKSGLKILEIGAGTGAATQYVLESLTRKWYTSIDCYDYTDISTAFFERARIRFQEWSSFMHYQVLDIAHSPLEQGFAEGGYDLVIASNALHVTSRVDEAISHARTLLRADGYLLLVEATRNVPFVNLMCGHFEGWYCGLADGRIDSPLLSKEEWHARLKANSFSGVDFSADDAEGPVQRVSFLASCATPVAASSDPTPVVRVLKHSRFSPHHSTFVEQLDSAFRNRGWQSSMLGLPLEDNDDEAIYVVVDDGDDPLLSRILSEELRSLTRLLARRGTRLLWVNVAHESPKLSNCEYSLAYGLCRTARLENSDLKVVNLDMQESLVKEHPECLQVISDVLLKAFIWSKERQVDEYELNYKDDQLYIPRLKPDRTLAPRALELELGAFHQESRPLKLSVQRPGLLDSMYFIDDVYAHEPLGPEEVKIRVSSYGVNFKDVMVALGQLDESVPMAGEIAGTIIEVGADFQHMFSIGDRVFAFGGTPYASQARVHGFCTYHIPDSMSFNDAASIPVIFCTAFHGLFNLARLGEQSTVLIHAGAGGVGQAAIQVAQSIGAEIFVTVGSDPKKQFIMEKHQIPEDHIFSSRSSLFKQSILRMTRGQGVDVVLNSLSGDLLQDGLDCLSRFGSFIEIGKFDINARNTLNLHAFEKGISFFSFDLTDIGRYRPKQLHELISQIMPFFESKKYIPIQPITVMPLTEIETAFRLLQSGKQTGKIVLEATTDMQVMTPPMQHLPAKLSDTGTYVVAGGLSGLGKEVGRFLANRGAKNIVLISRRMLNEVEKEALRDEFATLGAKVVPIQCDISKSTCKEVLSKCLDSLPPVEGIIQSAMVASGQAIGSMSLVEWNEALAPKVAGTLNLADALQSSSPKFFIMLSSVSSIFGLPGGSNYSAANAFQDAFARKEENIGKRFVSINLGRMGDTGALTRTEGLDQKVAELGFIQWGVPEFLNMLDYVIRSSDNVSEQVVTGFTRDSFLSAKSNVVARNPMLKHILRNKGYESVEDTRSSKTKASMRDIRDSITNARDLAETQSIIRDQLAARISLYTSREANELGDNIPLSSFGLDSLVIIELKNWINRTFQAALGSSDILDATHLSALSATVAKSSTLVDGHTESLHSETTSQNGENSSMSSFTANQDDKSIMQAASLPKQPVLDFDDGLQNYLAAVKSFSSFEEHERTKKAAQDFRLGKGQELQQRLLERGSKCDNLLADLYSSRFFLQNRTPLLFHSTYFLSLVVTGGVYRQADVAAATCVAVFDYKRKLEEGYIGTHFLGGEAVDSDSYNSLFNTCREPHENEDRMHKHESQDYFVVLRNGQAFKVDQDRESPLSFSELKSTFQDILELQEIDHSNIGILTADHRGEWAENREHLLSLDPANAAVLRLIEASAFVVCLDASCTESYSHRALQYSFGDASLNRWFDKSLQFVICSDGRAAVLVDHTLLDGVSLAPMREHMVPTLFAELSRSSASPSTSVLKPKPSLSRLTFKIDHVLESRMPFVKDSIKVAAADYTFAAFKLPGIGSDYWRALSISPRAGVQLIIQLASHSYFGHNPPSIENLSLARFRRGRIAHSPTVWPSVVALCEHINTPELSESLEESRRLFRAAATVLNQTAARATKGLAPNRHLLGLEWMLEDGEERPALFDDPVYKRLIHDPVLRTSAFESDVEELADSPTPGGLLVSFQPQHDRVLVSITGRGESKAPAFRKYVEMAAEKIQSIFGK